VTRTTCFGSLSLPYTKLENHVLQRLFDHLHLFEYLDIPDLPHQLIPKLLAAPIRSVGLSIFFDREVELINLENAEIVPKAIRIEIGSEDDRYPKRFMLSFLNRVAQLGHLEELESSVMDKGNECITTRCGKALARAVRNNKNLKKFSFMVHEHQWGSRWKDLFHAVERHEGLQKFEILGYPDHADPNSNSWNGC
jgi:hypothetical protein